MNTSKDIGEIAKALAAAQAKLSNPKRNREVNTGKFKYSYATHDSIIDLVRPVLAEVKLSIHQGVVKSGAPDGSHGEYWVETLLMHESGQWMATTTPLPYTGSIDAQALGSALSYARRYGLSAMLGIASEEDDDGKAASSRNGGKEKGDPKLDALRAELESCGSMRALEELWKKMTPSQRKALFEEKEVAKGRILEADGGEAA